MGNNLTFKDMQTGDTCVPKVNGEVLQFIMAGAKINAIKELRALQGTYFSPEHNTDLSVMGLRDAKEIVEEIADTMFPPKRTTCEECSGRGYHETYNADHPFFRR